MTARASAAPISNVRERWKMGVEARAMVLLTSILLAFGLAVLYSASWKFAMPLHCADDVATPCGHSIGFVVIGLNATRLRSTFEARTT